MRRILTYILYSILLSGFVTQSFAKEVYLNNIKEPKIIFQETITEPKKDTIIKTTSTQNQEPKELPVSNTQPLQIIKSSAQTPLNEPIKREIIPIKQTETLKKEKVAEATITAPKISLSNKRNEPIAIIFASNTIGKYSIEATNIAMTYLVNKNMNFSLHIFDMELETKENIGKTLDIVKEKGIKKVICLVTSNNIWGLNSYPEIGKFDIYLPLVNKSNVTNPKANYIFGGIDYGKQFQFLASKSSSHIVEIYDESAISKTLHSELAKLNLPNIKYLQLLGKNPNYNPLFSKSSQIKNATVILNTSIVKSAIVLALLRGNNVIPKEVFATQLNYSPVIFNLTQEEDRENLFVANSIELLPRDLEELISFFGEDVVFNWVNYSTILGLEYFMTHNKKLFGNIEIKENQVNYPIKLYGFEGTKFIDAKK
ncbi:MAG: hypothetical protein RBT59_06990 [Arcobacteraceae bacterium]|nr:hypothetical protein [Arcobacteraceae bacterium]